MTEFDDAQIVKPDQAADEAEALDFDTAVVGAEPKAGLDWSRILAYGVVPALALLLALAAGYFKFVDDSVRDDATASAQSVQAAKATAIAMLSYSPDKIDVQLNAARTLLTGPFQDSYTSLINDVVIPGAKQQQISVVAAVPWAGSVSATPTHAVVLLFVNRTVVVGGSAPSSSASTVRATLDKVNGTWLISEFAPI